MLYLASKLLKAKIRIGIELVNDPRVQPGALVREVVEGLRQVPVVKGHERLDTCGQEGVKQVVVEFNSQGVGGRGVTCGENPGPGD